MRRIVCATMKDEGPYLLEWIAYHRTIGFDGFIVCSNDCSDGTNLMLNRLDAMGLIHHIDNPQGPNMDPQRSAYGKIKAHPAFQAAEWALVIDADEFLNVKCGDRSLEALIDACPEADAISCCWKLMGSSGETRFDADALVTERFTRGSNDEAPENGLVWGFKTLFRPQKFDYLGVHRPRFLKHKPMPAPGEVRWVNGSGKDLGATLYEKGWRLRSETYGYALAQINHYAIKSREDFVLKRLRGTANAKDKDRINEDYWGKYDLNACHDDSIDTTGVRAERARLLTDPILDALQRASIDCAERTLRDQMQDPAIWSFVETGLFPGQSGKEAAE